MGEYKAICWLQAYSYFYIGSYSHILWGDLLLLLAVRLFICIEVWL